MWLDVEPKALPLPPATACSFFPESNSNHDHQKEDSDGRMLEDGEDHKLQGAWFPVENSQEKFERELREEAVASGLHVLQDTLCAYTLWRFIFIQTAGHLCATI